MALGRCAAPLHSPHWFCERFLRAWQLRYQFEAARCLIGLWRRPFKRPASLPDALQPRVPTPSSAIPLRAPVTPGNLLRLDVWVVSGHSLGLIAAQTQEETRCGFADSAAGPPAGKCYPLTTCIDPSVCKMAGGPWANGGATASVAHARRMYRPTKSSTGRKTCQLEVWTGTL